MSTALALATPAVAVAQWTYVSSGTTAELRGLGVVNEQVIWASGARGTVLQSLDAGKTWRADTVRGASTLDFRAVHGLNRLTGFLASAGEAEKGLAKIYSTDDGGRTWAQSDTIAMNSVRFSGTTGVAVGPRGRIAWTNGVVP